MSTFVPQPLTHDELDAMRTYSDASRTCRAAYEIERLRAALHEALDYATGFAPDAERFKELRKLARGER